MARPNRCARRRDHRLQLGGRLLAPAELHENASESRARLVERWVGRKGARVVALGLRQQPTPLAPGLRGCPAQSVVLRGGAERLQDRTAKEQELPVIRIRPQPQLHVVLGERPLPALKKVHAHGQEPRPIEGTPPVCVRDQLDRLAGEIEQRRGTRSDFLAGTARLAVVNVALGQEHPGRLEGELLGAPALVALCAARREAHQTLDAGQLVARIEKTKARGSRLGRPAGGARWPQGIRRSAARPATRAGRARASTAASARCSLSVRRRNFSCPGSHAARVERGLNLFRPELGARREGHDRVTASARDAGAHRRSS